MTATEQNELARQWLPLAYRMARQFVAGKASAVYGLDDARSDAALALAKAVQRYDSTRGITWAGYLTWCIKMELRDRLRRRLYLDQDGNRHARPRHLPTADGLTDLASRDRPVFDNEDAFARLISPLTDREQRMMRLIYEDGRCRAELAPLLGVSRQRVFELYENAIAHLREVTQA